MIIVLIAILLGSAALIRLWKGPVKKIVQAMEKSGSSSFEAYATITLLTGGIAFAVYMIAQVL